MFCSQSHSPITWYMTISTTYLQDCKLQQESILVVHYLFFHKTNCLTRYLWDLTHECWWHQISCNHACESIKSLWKTCNQQLYNFQAISAPPFCFRQLCIHWQHYIIMYQSCSSAQAPSSGVLDIQSNGFKGVFFLA